MHQKGFLNIILILIVVALVGVGIYFVSFRKITAPAISPTPTLTPTPTPTPILNGEKVIRKIGEREGSFLIQKINPDSVDGLWYQAYPVATLNGVPKTLRIRDDIGYACEGVSEKLISINFSDQTITFNKVIGPRPFGGCPI